MSAPSNQQEFAHEIVVRLRGVGYEALWAGGCVRDRLLGLVPKDFDVATSATPDEIRTLFGRRRTLPIGAAFGVITVLGPRAAGQIDVATFRSDASYSDGRRPDRVTFTTAREDALRRDFTINGLFYDPIADEVIDYVEGRRDLENRIVRAIGDPATRFAEDKLRMLRAIRFAATYAFEIDRATSAAIERMAPEIGVVSAERIGMELRRMLVDRHRSRAVELLRTTGLLREILPEVAALEEAPFQATLAELANLETATLPVALAALLRRPSTSAPSGAGSERCASLATEVARRLRYTNKEADRADWLLQRLPLIGEAASAPWPRLQRVLIHEGAEELLTLREAIAGPADAEAAFCRERLAWPAERLNPPPLLSGADLIAAGIRPGPSFASLLEEVRDAQLRGEIFTREDALALVEGRKSH